MFHRSSVVVRSSVAGSCAAAFLWVLCAGCTIKPGNLEITPRDQETYNDPAGGPLTQAGETKLPVAILVSEGKTRQEKETYKALDAVLTSVLSDFAFFTIVERSNLAALQKEKTLEELRDDQLSQIDIPKAQYLITARISAAAMEPVSFPSGSFQGVVHVDYRFYEKAGNRVVLTKNLEGASPSYTKPPRRERNAPPPKIDPAQLIETDEGIGKLVEAVQESAKAFAVELGKRYAPAARVVETRGEGKVARITLGTNYGVTDNARVEFFEFVDNSGIVAGATHEPRIVGYGKVIEVDQASAWVEVDSFKKVKVLKGHYSRLAAKQEKASGLGAGFKALLK